MKLNSQYRFYLMLLGGGIALFLISEILASPKMPDASWPEQNLSQEYSLK
ncbi:MAG: hypothetical protein V4525_15005 [Pseudomonadota bacterium]